MKLKTQISKIEIWKRPELLKLIFKILMSILLLISFFVIVIAIQEGNIKGFDSYIYQLTSKLLSPDMTIFFKTITFLCDTAFILLMLVIIFFSSKKKWYPILLSMNVAGIFVLNQVAKLIFARQRPSGINLIDVTGYSFPSGHSMVSFTFYGYIIYLIYKNINNIYFKIASMGFLTIIIFLIGMSRIYLGVHYASDVVGGYLLSLVYLIFFTYFIKEKPELKRKGVL